MDNNQNNTNSGSGDDNKSIKDQNIPQLSLEQQLEEANNKIAILTDSAKRALADLENFKKRIDKEREASKNYQTANIILGLLPMVDNLERAAINIPSELQNHEWRKGLDLLNKQFKDFLKEKGLQEINETNIPLDPNKHEAMMQGPGKENLVIEIFEKGYILGDKVIRAAKVKIGNGEKN